MSSCEAFLPRVINATIDAEAWIASQDWWERIMPSISMFRVLALGGIAALTACGGGGGGGSSNPPAPSPADTTAPDTTISSAPGTLTNQPAATFQFTSTEAGTF